MIVFRGVDRLGVWRLRPGSVAGLSDRGHAPETDDGPSVTKPAVRSAESPFLVEVQEYRSRRSAVERLFRASCHPGHTCES